MNEVNHRAINEKLQTLQNKANFKSGDTINKIQHQKGELKVDTTFSLNPPKISKDGDAGQDRF